MRHFPRSLARRTALVLFLAVLAALPLLSPAPASARPLDGGLLDTLRALAARLAGPAASLPSKSGAGLDPDGSTGTTDSGSKLDPDGAPANTDSGAKLDPDGVK
jgi:hypothetical protein